MDHLEEAKRFVGFANTAKHEWAAVNAQVAIAHAAIAQAESTRALAALVEQLLKRLPPPAEPWSECMKRLGEEWRAQEEAQNEL